MSSRLPSLCSLLSRLFCDARKNQNVSGARGPHGRRMNIIEDPELISLACPAYRGKLGEDPSFVTRVAN